MDEKFDYQYPYFSAEDVKTPEKFQQKNKELAAMLLDFLPPDMRKLYSDVLSRAEQFYADIPYHNRAHHLAVTNFAIIIALALGKQELLPGLIVGGLWHDAGYDQDHLSLGFETKEDYSIALMREHEGSADTPPEIINIAADAIEGTKIENQDFSTEGRKILRAADIRGLGGSFDVFEVNSLNIKDEVELLQGISVPMNMFADKQCEILQRFFDQSDTVPEVYFQMNGKFYERFGQNIDTFRNKYGG